MSVTVQISDAELRKAMRNVASWTEAKKDRVRVAIATTAINVDRKAKEKAPVDTGRLRSSIHPEFTADRLGAEVSTNVEYAIHQEFGAPAANVPARPFMHPAAESERVPFKARMIAALRAKERVNK